MVLKKCRLALSVFLLFTALNTVNAQIENEIISFVDSTELLVNNGRRMLLQHVQSKDYHRAAEIHSFLNLRANAKNCAVFYYNEELYISILTNNWNDFFTKAENFSEVIRIPFCILINDRILDNTLYWEVRNEVAHHLKNAQNANLTSEDKDLMELYLHIIGYQKNEIYDRKLKNFKKKYPQSRYSDFVNNYLPSPSFRFGMTFGFGAAQIFPTGNLSNYFMPSTAGNISVDFYFNNFLIGGLFNAGSMNFKKPLLSQSTGYDHDFQKNDRLSYIDGGFLLGYTSLRSNRLQLTPFVLLGGTSLKSNFYRETADKNLEFKILDSFIFGTGLRTEINILNFSIRDAMTNTQLPSSINLRLDVGYNIPVKYNFAPAKGNVLYTRMALVWWFGRTF